jgi:NADPH-dependent 2,4-dienoyl-CoA reductase/sulfur reductase-like enzyme
LTERSPVERLVIVGASLAGLRAAESARRTGYDGEIVLIGEEEHHPYDRPPLSKQLLENPDHEIPYLRDESHYANELRVDLMLGRAATALLADESVVVVGGDDRVEYDALVIATGAAPRALPGLTGTPGVLSLRNIDETVAIRKALHEGKPMVVVGAGFIGAEVASAFRGREGDVTIVEATSSPLARVLGEGMGTRLSEMHGRHGTSLLCGVTVTELERNGDGVSGVVLSDGQRIAAEVVLVSIGAVPATAWLQSSGIAMNPDGGIICDSALRSSLPDVYAAGDIVHWPNEIMDVSMRLEQWTSAHEQGTTAGRNAVSGAGESYQTVPYFWSDWYKNRIQFVGRAGDSEPEVVSGAVDDDRFVALYRDGDRLVGALAVNEPSRIMKDRRRISQRASWSEALDAYGVAS